MPPKLLDVNVLLSLLWPPHGFHPNAIKWFLNHQQEGWATCPLTEMGFLRIVTNPAFTPDPPRITDAIELLAEAKRTSRHHVFWPDSTPGDVAIAGFGSAVIGHKQISDAYLLSLAIQHKATFATFDKRVLQLASAGSKGRALVEILQ